MSVSVDDAVESMAKKAVSGNEPEDKSAEPKAPVENTKTEDQTKPEATQTPDDTSKGSDGLTSFEKELLNELEADEKAEFDGLTATEKSSRLKWMKTRYRRDARSKTELGNLRKAASTLREAGVTNEDLLTLINSKRTGKAVDAPTGDQKITKRGFDKLMESASTPEDREQLTTTRQVVREEMEDMLRDVLKKEVGPLKDRLDASDRQRQTSRSQSLETEINELEDKLGYPGSLIETYRDDIASWGIRNPDMSAEEILFKLAPPKQLKDAMQSSAATQPNKDTPKPTNRIVSKASPPSPPKNSRGVVSISNALDLILKRK